MAIFFQVPLQMLTGVTLNEKSNQLLSSSPVRPSPTQCILHSWSNWFCFLPQNLPFLRQTIYTFATFWRESPFWGPEKELKKYRQNIWIHTHPIRPPWRCRKGRLTNYVRYTKVGEGRIGKFQMMQNYICLVPKENMGKSSKMVWFTFSITYNYIALESLVRP